MGGRPIEFTLQGTASDVRKTFDEAVKESLHEKGHSSYSGGWGTISHLWIDERAIHPDIDTATEQLDQLVSKGDAIAQRFWQNVKPFRETETHQKLERAVINARGARDWTGKLILDAIREKSGTKRCINCGSSIAVKYLPAYEFRGFSCLVCKHQGFCLNAKQRRELERADQKILDAEKAFEESKTRYEQENPKELHWIVYGIASC